MPITPLAGRLRGVQARSRQLLPTSRGSRFPSTALALCFALAVTGCLSAGSPVTPEPADRINFESSGADGEYEQLAAVARRVAPAYVAVRARADGRSVPAAGTVVAAGGWVVTAAHLLGSSRQSLRLETLGGRRLSADLVARLPGQDLALLRADDPDLPAAKIALPGQLRPGEPVFAIGSPFGITGTVTPGRVLELRHPGRVEVGGYGVDDAISLRMEVRRGHSGGPLFNARGELVGIVALYEVPEAVAGTGQAPRTGYAVPLESVLRLLANAGVELP